MGGPGRCGLGRPPSEDEPAAGEPPTAREPSGGDGAATGQRAPAPPAAPAGPSARTTALAGVREPIVVVLLLIAFFTWISGKPLDGLLMLVAAVSLAWDTARRARHGGPAESSPAAKGAIPAAAGGAARRRPWLLLAWLAAGALYVVVVGSFSRYSWPATAAVVALGVAVVAAGWRGPRHPGRAPAKLPAIGLALWGLVLVAGSLWELTSLFEQPSLTTDSYAHPTISTLTDPVLSSWAGRSVVLAAWLGLGWFLVER